MLKQMQGSLTTGSEYAQTLVSDLRYLKNRSLRREGQGDSILEFVSPRGSSRSLKAEHLLSHLLVQKYLPHIGKFEFTHPSGLSDLSLGSILSSPHTAVRVIWFYLFIFTEGEAREKKKRERNISVREKHWSGFQTPPRTKNWGPNWKPKYGDDGTRTADILLAGRCPTNWVTLVNARVIFLMDHLMSLFSRTYSDSFPS